MPKTDAELFVNYLPTVILMLTALMTDLCHFDLLTVPFTGRLPHPLPGIFPLLSTLQLPSPKEGNGWL
jgi:hypothetical protein